MSDKKTEKKPLVPRLRFPEFRDSGEWEECPLEKAADFVRERIPCSDVTSENYISTENILPEFRGVVTSSSLPTSGTVVSYQKNDILAANIRPYLKKIWLADKNGGASNDVIVIRAKKKINHLFLSHLLINDCFIDYVMSGAKGLKMPRGELSLIREYPTPLPQKDEQKKIAACLSSLDELISSEFKNINLLKAHKKGLMQQIFPCAGENVPRQRFTSFAADGYWQERTLKNCADIFASGDLDIKLFSKNKSVTHPYSVFSNAIEKEGLFGFYTTAKYDEQSVTITARGTLGVAFLRNEKFMGIGRLLILTNFQGISPYFFKECWNFLAKVPNEVTSIPQLTSIAVRKMQLPLPLLPEQKKIADCLSSLDELIAAQGRKIELLKLQKKGLMQQLFPEMDEVTA